MKHSLISLAFVYIFAHLTSLSFSQNGNPVQTPPLDPQVITGVLPNGMKYFIQENKLPEKRGEFYIVTNVGAIQEEDQENGLAHFSEHMAFNGTSHFPKKGILDYLARIGVKFGQNVNASTGVEQTMYNISNVPLTREGILDTALLILHDWASSLSFEAEEIDLERGVIIEEWRMYGSADERMSNELRPVVYKDSKYARRDVIGDTAVLRNFSHQTIREFFRKWYRPDLQAVIVVGDFDGKMVEKKIKQVFSAIPKAVNPKEKTLFPLPENTEPLVGIASDKEATTTEISVNFKHPATPDSQKDLAYMRQQVVRNLINAMMAQRFAELSRSPDAPFLRAYSGYGSFTKGWDAFRGSASAANNQAEKALTALLTELERMRRFGFSEGELERAKATTLRNYESRFLDRNKRKNRELVYPLVSYFLRNNPNPGIEFENQFAQEALRDVRLDEVNRMASASTGKKNMIVTVTGPKKEGTLLPTEAGIRAIISQVANATITPYEDAWANKQLFDKKPVPGKVMAESENPALGTVEWTLSNGIRIAIKPTDIREDELIINGYSEGGLSKVPLADLPAAEFLGDVVSEMGLGNFSRTDLSKILAGKRASVFVNVARDQDQVMARTSPKDLETALQMIHLQFTNPRWNQEDFTTWKNKVKANYLNADAEPRKAFRDTITLMLGNHSSRTKPMNSSRLEEVGYENLKRVFSDRFADPQNFLFIFTGNIDLREAKPLIEKYLGSLAGLKRNELAEDDQVRPPKGKTTNDFTRTNTTPRSSVYVCYHGSQGTSPTDWLLGAAIRHCLELRYTQAIREDEGGTYSVRVSWTGLSFPEPAFRFVVSFDTDPAKTTKLVSIVHDQINLFLKNGPKEEDLAKAKEFFLKQFAENQKENSWWSSMLADFYCREVDYITGYPEMVKQLNMESVRNHAIRTLGQENVLQVVMRP